MEVNVLMVSAAIFVVLVGRLIASLLKVRRNYVRVKKLMEDQGIRGPPPSSWIAGNTLEMSKVIDEDMPSIDHNFVSWIWPCHSKHLKEYDGNKYLSWHLSLQPALHVAEAQLSLEIQTRVSDRPQAFKKILDSVFGKGVLNADVKQWVGQRAQLVPAFHADKLKNMVDTMVTCTNGMIKTWQQKINAAGGSTEIEVQESMIELTANIIGETAFGIKQGEVNKKCVHLINELQDQIIRQALYVTLIPGYKYLPTKENLLERRMNKEMYDILSEVIRTRLRETPPRSTFFGHDMLGLLLSATVPADRKNVDISYLVDECKTFFLAGHETSAQVLTWSMFLLALHPDWQQRAREEVRGLHGRHTAELNKLKIVGMIISESLRLYPIAPQIPRETTEDIQVNSLNKKLVILKGTLIFIDVLTIQHRKDLWGEDADEFRPDRFASQVNEGGTGKYSPFGLGPRMCLGRGYALTEMKLVMGMILDKFEWRLSPSYRHSPKMHFTVCPRHGMQLIISQATC